MTPSPGTIARNAATIVSRRSSTAESDAGIIMAMAAAPDVREETPICDGKSSTSSRFWVGWRAPHIVYLRRKSRRRHETCATFVACPAQAGHATYGPRNSLPAPPSEEDEEHPMNRLTLSTLVAVTSMAAVSGALAQDAAAGKTSFNKCMACHSIGAGA